MNATTLLSSAFVASCLLALGCNGTVTYGSSGDPGDNDGEQCLCDCDLGCDGEGGGVSTGGGGVGGGTFAALVMTEEQVDSTYPPSSDGSTGQSGGGTPPPSDRMAFFIDQSPTAPGLVCSDPYAYDSMCVVERNILTVFMPSDLVTPGVYSMGQGDIFVGTSETGPNEGSGDCWGGGSGGWSDGTVEIVSVDAEQIEIIVSGGPVGTVHAFAQRCAE